MNGTSSRDRDIAGLVIRHRGIARTLYEIPVEFQPPGYDVMLVVANDSICAYGFALSACIADKAEITTALNIFWRRKLDELGLVHDLVAHGSEIDEYLPVSLRNNKWLHRRSLVVRVLDRLPLECILRNHIAGTAWHLYQKTGMAYGQCFEPGLKYGAKLADTVFTPKIRSGHVPLEFQDGLAVIGLRPMEKGLIAYQSAYEYALSCGIVIADTNFEMGTRPESELLSFGGDILTPDSSRYWDEDVYKEYWVGGKRPEKVELEHLREYARSIGIQKLDPKKPYDRRCVRALPVPVDICNMTTMIFSQIMIRITKKDLISYQEQDMNIT